MKLTLTPSGLTPFVLGDDSVLVITASTWANGAGGAIKEGFVNKQNRSVQPVAYFRGAYLANIPRYNLENRFTFTVQRCFTTAANCISFIAAHPDTAPTDGEITLTNATTGTVTRYLPNGVLQSIECVRHAGVSCDFLYTILGNGPWQTTA